MSAGFAGNWPAKHIEPHHRHKHNSAGTRNCTDMSHGTDAQSRRLPGSNCMTRRQDDLATDSMDTLAERSEAVAQGPIPKGQGLRPHRCHFCNAPVIRVVRTQSAHLQKRDLSAVRGLLVRPILCSDMIRERAGCAPTSRQERRNTPGCPHESKQIALCKLEP